MNVVDLRKVLEAFKVIDLERHTFRYLCDPGVAGSTIEFRHARGLRQFPRQRMLSSTVAYNEHVHRKTFASALPLHPKDGGTLHQRLCSSTPLGPEHSPHLTLLENQVKRTDRT
jgi:hypothetical protein